MGLEIKELQASLKELFKNMKAEIVNNGNLHKTIPEKDLDVYLNKGWELVEIYSRVSRTLSSRFHSLEDEETTTGKDDI